MRAYCTMPYFGFKAKLLGNALMLRVLLYHALFWIQGKTARRGNRKPYPLYHALFWIQGKTDIREKHVFVSLYHALFWIQGKTIKVEKTTTEQN